MTVSTKRKNVSKSKSKTSSKSNKGSSSRKNLIKSRKSGMKTRKMRGGALAASRAKKAENTKAIIEEREKIIIIEGSEHHGEYDVVPDLEKTFQKMTAQINSIPESVENLYVNNLSGEDGYGVSYIESPNVVKALNSLFVKLNTFRNKDNLKILSLDHNSLDFSNGDDIRELCENMKVLVNFGNLTTFNFSYIVLENHDTYNQIVETLVSEAVLQKLKSLTSLNLSGNYISKKSIIQLLKTIIKMNIESLNLSDTQIHTNIIKILLPQFLTPNPEQGYDPTIKELIIKKNNIDDAGAEAFAKVLRVNTTLTKLDIRYNMISDAKKEALKEEFGDRLIL
jgi:hypothetical protein